MTGLRRLATGAWNRPPLLSCARAVFAKGLSSRYKERALGEMATFVNGTSYDAGHVGGGQTAIIRISNMTDPSAEYVRTSESFDSRFHVARGDLLVSWSASFKTILWPGPAGILNQHIFKVVEGGGVSRSYLRHAIEAAFDEMRRSVVGIGMMHLRRADFLGHSVPCPPLEVQSAIGAYLDWIETSCEGQEPSLPSGLEGERSLIRQIRSIATNLDEVAGLRLEASRETGAILGARLSEVAAQWEPLGCLGEVLTAKPRNGWSARGDDDPNGTPVLTLSAVTGFEFTPDAFKRTSLPVERDAHYWLNEGDLLITRSNTPELVGHAAIYDGSPHPCIYPDLMMRLPVDRSRVNVRFTWYWLQAPAVRAYVRAVAQGTSPTMKKINQKHVLEIPFPTGLGLPEQEAITRSLDALRSRILEARRAQAEARDDLDAILPSLFNQVLEGELVAN